MNENRHVLWRPHTCNICSYRSKSNFVIFQHLKLHARRLKTDTFNCHLNVPELLECEFCTFCTHLKVHLSEHFRVFHEGEKANEKLENIECLRCKNCDFETHSVLILTNHVDECSMMSKHKQNDKKRRSRARGDTWFKCEHCAYKTRYSSKLKFHGLLKHTNSDDIVDQLNIVPGSENDNSYEYISSVGLRWCKCKHCNYKSTNKSIVRRHFIAKHTNPEDINWFECPHCVYKGKEKVALERHMIAKHTHPEKIPWFECGHCPFKAKSKGNLKQHVRKKHYYPINMGWFKCVQCAYQTNSEAALTIHLKKHSNRFKCSLCSFKSKNYGILKNHIGREHGESEI